MNQRHAFFGVFEIVLAVIILAGGTRCRFVEDTETSTFDDDGVENYHRHNNRQLLRRNEVRDYKRSRLRRVQHHHRPSPFSTDPSNSDNIFDKPRRLVNSAETRRRNDDAVPDEVLDDGGNDDVSLHPGDYDDNKDAVEDVLLSCDYDEADNVVLSHVPVRRLGALLERLQAIRNENVGIILDYKHRHSRQLRVQHHRRRPSPSTDSFYSDKIFDRSTRLTNAAKVRRRNDDMVPDEVHDDGEGGMDNVFHHRVDYNELYNVKEKVDEDVLHDDGEGGMDNVFHHRVDYNELYNVKEKVDEDVLHDDDEVSDDPKRQLDAIFEWLKAIGGGDGAVATYDVDGVEDSKTFAKRFDDMFDFCVRGCARDVVCKRVCAITW